jgi:hypothetical protein
VEGEGPLHTEVDLFFIFRVFGEVVIQELKGIRILRAIKLPTIPNVGSIIESSLHGYHCLII